MKNALAEAETLLTRYEEEPQHVRHVAALAGQLFDSLRDWHRLGEEAAQYLQLSALLHDIGWSQSPGGTGHHKWSAKLIAAHPWKHLAPEAVPIIAQTARYHRRSLPSDEHEGYQLLNADQRQLVCELGGILRVADALDRTHTQVVRQVAAQISSTTIELRVTARGPWLNERKMVAKKCDLLEIASRRKVLAIPIEAAVSG